MWNVAAVYFRLQEQPYDTRILQPSAPPAQQNVLYATMESDVQKKTERGVESFLEDWRLISLYHEDNDIKLVRLEQHFNNAIVTTNDKVMITTKNTLHYAFPHLTNTEPGRTFASKILDQQYNSRLSAF
ncbi:hypothetical protein L915_10972 [Phytophthora nicotianae]|uniref:Uncharacterized protein n=1 Tax=Phytophthora nicotianae TaxID=4792 RepID=W2GP10_PHYNI|nr:hypothetical protein L915_10972 [Phytophthora nicotianae]ETM43883.1 hypothetical protein L914_10808 [Phytophthora nicotianae]